MKISSFVPEIGFKTSNAKRNTAILTTLAAAVLSFSVTAGFSGAVLFGSAIAIGLGAALAASPIVATVFFVALGVGIITTIAIGAYIAYTKHKENHYHQFAARHNAMLDKFK